MKYKEGQEVVITMMGHIYNGELGIVEMVLENPSQCPPAVLVDINGYMDWFFGTENNIRKKKNDKEDY